MLVRIVPSLFADSPPEASRLFITSCEIRGGFREGWREARALPIFCNHLQAGNVSISLASSKSWISPLKAFENMISSSNFYNMEKWTKFENASMRQKLICQKKVSNVIMAFQTIWNLELSSSANHGR